MPNDTVNDLLKSIIRNPSQPVVFPTTWEKITETYVAEEDPEQDEKEFEENDPE